MHACEDTLSYGQRLRIEAPGRALAVDTFVCASDRARLGERDLGSASETFMLAIVGQAGGTRLGQGDADGCRGARLGEHSRRRPLPRA